MNFLTILFFMVRNFSPLPFQNWSNTPFHLSAASYSMYWQLCSIAEGSSSIRNPIIRHAVLTRDPPNMVKAKLYD
jgi:hypothetical protein